MTDWTNLMITKSNRQVLRRRDCTQCIMEGKTMAIEYLGLNSVNGPFVVLEGVKGAAYDEIVEIVADGKEKSLAVS